MSEVTFYHTGRIELSKDSSNWVNASFGDAKISVSPEYITHKNILSNEINILKGYKLEAELELFFVKNDINYFNVDEFISILNSMNYINNGIIGYQSNIYLRFRNTQQNIVMITFEMNKLASDILLTNYVSNNMRLGHKIEVKLGKSELLNKIPFWTTLDNTYFNDVLHLANKTVASDGEWNE